MLLLSVASNLLVLVLVALRNLNQEICLPVVPPTLTEMASRTLSKTLIRVLFQALMTGRIQEQVAG
jgi:hypothetical protein